jgi:hypothetical protein
MNNLRTLTNMKKAILTAMAVASLAILPATAQAVPIAGDLNLSGRVTVDATTINWLELGGFLTDNEFLVLDGTGYFDALDVTPGDALDLDSTLYPTGTPISLANFLTFDANPGLNFELQLIAQCDPTACLFPGTPFNAYETTVDGIVRTTVELAMRGEVTDSGNPGESAQWIGTWSNAFIGVTIADLQAAFAPGGPGFITAPYAADLTVTTNVTEVPEPATLLTFGAGTALMAAHRRRRAKKTVQQ